MKRILSVLLLGLAAAPAFATTQLFFDDFDTNTSGPNRTPAGWSRSAGQVDIVGPGYYPDLCYDIGRCIDMDGSGGGAGAMQTTQTFSLLAGETYTLSFQYSWNYFMQQNPNTMDFGVGGIMDSMTTTGTRPLAWLSKSFSFLGDGSTGGIRFKHYGSDYGGIIIDDVKLVGPLVPTGGGQTGTPPVPAPVPLPLPAAMLGVALAGFAWFGRRRA